MLNVQYTLISNGDEENLTVIAPGRAMPLVAHSSHPNFEAIKTAVVTEDGDADWESLFDVGVAVAKRFERLTQRITVANGEIFLDGDAVHNSLTQQILRFMDEGEDFGPLVRFMDKVVGNPCEHSREQLYDWLSNHEGITITPIGNILGYKGVRKKDDGTMESKFSGTAIVDGVQVEGKIPNQPGSTIEMPRSEVAHDPSSACSTGLHVGTWAYASGYAAGAMLECHVDPRDVVSVPTDAGGEKVRVCRYIIAGVLDAPYTTALKAEVDGEDAADDLDPEDERCFDCEEYVEDCACDEGDEW